ncbi:MAG TPA: hypothetical protein VKG44_05205 [Candidatus Baltobacteraceae bacterium]|nr:hypothetical protein [Candidatus Baltobacteraceae bacterium]
MLTSVTKLADANFVLGFFLPALIGVIAAAYAFPATPFLSDIFSHLGSDKSLGDVTYIVLTIWVLAVALLALNYELYRELEGYLAPISWFAFLKDWHKRRFQTLRDRYDALNDQWAAQKNAFPPVSLAELMRIKIRLTTEYPPYSGEVMTTAFGNRIRAFEVYPREVYGADGVSLWLRLASTVSKDFQALVGAARAQVDFLVNLSYISLALAVSCLIRALGSFGHRFYPWIPNDPDLGRHVFLGILTLLASYLTYRWATVRVSAWGELVKSAFDCYLPSLGKQIGYALPKTESERRAFWLDFSQQILYQDRIRDGRWNLSAQTDAAKPNESDAGATENANTVD